MNEVVFLTSFSVYLPMVYKKATGFCMLVLEPTVFLEVLINFRNFLVESLGPVINRIVLSENKDILTPYFLFCIHFISFYCLLL